MLPIPASVGRYAVAEGPLVNLFDGSVSWVDINDGCIHVAEVAASGSLDLVRTIQLADRVGCAFPLAGGRFLAAVGRRLGIVGGHGEPTFSRELLGPGRRFNDGVIDAAGRLLVGSLSLDVPPTDNVLLRLEADGDVTTIDNQLELANGLAFSPDGRVLYVVDSLAHVIYARDYEPVSGEFGDRWVFASITDAEPDGIAVDADGVVWVALWRGHGLRRIGADGVVHGADVPIGPPHVTSVTFMGPASTSAIVTTASLVLSPDELVQYPTAGAIFIVDLGARGREPAVWAESPLPA